MKFSFLLLGFFLAWGLAQESAQAASFQSIVTEVLSKSPESQIWQAENKRIHYQKWQAWSEAMPRVNAYANAGRSAMPLDISSMGFGNFFGQIGEAFDSAGVSGETLNSIFSGGGLSNRVESDRYTYGLEINQPIFSFGRLGQSIKVARLEEFSLQQNHEAQKQQLVYQVFRTYGNILLGEAQLEVLRSSEKRQKETVDFLSRNLEFGSGTRSEYLLAKSGLLALDPQLIRAQNQVELARIQLAGLMGRSSAYTDSLVPLESAPFDTTLPVITGNPSQYAYTKRQDLLAMERQVQSLEAQAKYIRMLNRPSLGFQGKAGILAFDPDQLTEWENREWMVGVGLTWPLFDGRQNYNKSKQYSAESSILRARLNQMQTRVNIEVESAYAELSAARKSVIAAEQAF